LISFTHAFAIDRRTFHEGFWSASSNGLCANEFGDIIPSFDPQGGR
jgi:hypothetical protein